MIFSNCIINSMPLRPLPLGRSAFDRLRAQNCIYVDKTALICQLCQSEDKVFLSRPRRFGKSLLISAIDSLFRNGLRDFKGLAIEKLWNDKTYNVARLDFSSLKNIKNLKEFRTNFRSSIAASFAPLGFVYEPNNAAILFIDQLKSWLNSLPVNSLVILIDEYDAPLTDLLDNPSLFESVRGDLGNFFAAIKQCDSCMRFIFMTGITKYSSTSIFSGFNAFTDISLKPAYGTLLGLTEEEIKTYFSEYLNRAASALRTTAEDVLSSLRRNYDGFSFDQQASTHVYCPWSVFNFLKDPDLGFKDYWFSSGGQPSVLMKLLEERELDAPESYASDRFVRLEDLEASREYAEIDRNVLLAQAGYLTIKAVDDNGIVRLGYPNQEVAYALARLCARKLTSEQQVFGGGELGLREVLARGTAAEAVEAFSSALQRIDYQNYPIVNEAACRACIQILLLGASLMPAVEVHSALGRSDMEVAAADRRWIFEFKYAQKSSQVPARLAQAAEQIRKRRYVETAKEKHLLRVALVFCGEERRFSAYKEI